MSSVQSRRLKTVPSIIVSSRGHPADPIDLAGFGGRGGAGGGRGGGRGAPRGGARGRGAGGRG